MKLNTLVVKKKKRETYKIGLVRSTSVHLIYIGPFWSNSVQFSPFNLLHSLRPNLFHFSPIHSIQSTSFTWVQFGPLWSILVKFNSLRSIRFICPTSVQFGILGPFGLIQSISVHFSRFGQIWCTYLRMEKDKFWLRVLYYLSNINCNYRISFCYHNNLLKKIKFE